MARGKSDAYINFECEYKARTDKAVLIAYEDEDHWVPRSCLSYSCDKLVDTLSRGETFDLSVVEWMAAKIGAW